ncbi:MAG: hypothetical protein FJX92_06025 [Bacteroidetes bacterium]|nr:hypothetical protein [Bacteroidota bacterium]
MKSASVTLLLFLAGMILLPSCKKPSDANDENEHEAINKLELTFRQANQPDRVFIAEDPDGDGGLPPTRIDTIRLSVGQNYSVSFRALNIVSGVERDITPTIQAQANAHEIFYVVTGLGLQVVKLDTDSRGYPLGILSAWTTPSNMGTGSVLIKLMHKTGIKGPNDPPNIGHSDLELPMRIEIF